jgi:hypothetical protein
MRHQKMVVRYHTVFMRHQKVVTGHQNAATVETAPTWAGH